MGGFRGSPPRMRGKVAACCRWPAWPGITPAYAGKRLHKPLRAITIWDHPRVCGEKSLSICKPHVGQRITPAYAGKSCFWSLP